MRPPVRMGFYGTQCLITCYCHFYIWYTSSTFSWYFWGWQVFLFVNLHYLHEKVPNGHLEICRCWFDQLESTIFYFICSIKSHNWTNNSWMRAINRLSCMFLELPCVMVVIDFSLTYMNGNSFYGDRAAK